MSTASQVSLRLRATGQTTRHVPQTTKAIMKVLPVILSIAYNAHDSNVSVSIGNVILACVELGKLFRAKRVSGSPTLMELASIRLLQQYGLSRDDIDYLVVNADNDPYHSPLEQDVHETDTVFLGRTIPSLRIRHHCAHAGYYYLSGFDRALIVSCDGGGDLGERVAYFRGEGLSMERVSHDLSQHTSTTPYGQFSTYLYQEGFCAGKLMGLSAYGKPVASLRGRVEHMFPLLRDVGYVQGQSLLAKYFPGYRGIAKTSPKECANLTYAVQAVFEELRVRDVRSVFRTEHENLVLVGGSALNLNCNTELFKNITTRIYIPPCCDDSGIAIGQNAIAIAVL